MKTLKPVTSRDPEITCVRANVVYVFGRMKFDIYLRNSFLHNITQLSGHKCQEMRLNSVLHT